MILNLFLYVFLLFQDQESNFHYYPQTMVSKVLACCFKSHALLKDFYHYFSIASLCSVAPKITIKGKFFAFHVIFYDGIPDLKSCLVCCLCTWKRTANISRLPIGSPCWRSREPSRSWHPNILSMSHVESYFNL